MAHYTARVTDPTALPRDDADPAEDRPAGGVPAALNEGVLAGVLGYLLAQASVLTGAAFTRHIGGPLDLRPVEFSLLTLVGANEGCAPKQLCSALAVSAPHLTILLDRLESRGLLARSDSALDRRAREVRLTAEGRRIADAAAQQAQGMEQALLRRLSPAESAMLFELLRQLCGRPRA